MKYRISNLDRNLQNWFFKNENHSPVTSIELVRGNIRSLYPHKVDFEYPITAIAGVNGAGKTTILAMLAQTYIRHIRGSIFNDKETENDPLELQLLNTGNDYSSDELDISCQIRTSKKSSADKSNQSSNQASTTVSQDLKKNVFFLGLNRRVPYVERLRLSSGDLNQDELTIENESKISEIASRIFGREYNSYTHNSETDGPSNSVKIGDVFYTGIDMGTGESVVFHLLETIIGSKNHQLILIDEIELGLHESAQRKLIDELKKLCKDKKCQIIFTTHSKPILDSLPPFGRLYVISGDQQTFIRYGVSADHASMLMGDDKSTELNVFVEDEVARDIVLAWLDDETRRRINVIPIGSIDFVLDQMAACFRENRLNCMCILDGDIRKSVKKCVKSIIDKTGKEDKDGIIEEWATARIAKLPGKFSPEKWLFDRVLSHFKRKNKTAIHSLKSSLQVNCESRLHQLLKKAYLEDTHDMFFELSNSLKFEEVKVRILILDSVKRSYPRALSSISNEILKLLKE